MQNEVCPACLGAKYKTLDRVDTRDLIELYGREGVDVSRHFEATPEIRMNRCLTCDLVFFSPHCAGDGRFYEQLQKFDWYYQDEKPEYAYARNFISGSELVLEVGCGKGAFRAWLPESTKYVGLEFNDEAVRKARASGLNVIKQSVEEHAAQAAGKYDVVCSFQVLEHVPDPRAFVHACVQALRPGGKLILAVPSEDSFLGMATNAHLNMPPHHVLRWSDRALRRLALREGLFVIELWHEPVAEVHEDWHKETLARHYFVGLGLARKTLVDRSFTGKVLGRVLRSERVKDFFASRVAGRAAHAAHGHTVALVASKPVRVEVGVAPASPQAEQLLAPLTP